LEKRSKAALAPCRKGGDEIDIMVSAFWPRDSDGLRDLSLGLGAARRSQRLKVQARDAIKQTQEIGTFVRGEDRKVQMLGMKCCGCG
jgi:hypothetical protein